MGVGATASQVEAGGRVTWHCDRTTRCHAEEMTGVPLSFMAFTYASASAASIGPLSGRPYSVLGCMPLYSLLFMCSSCERTSHTYNSIA